MRRFKHPEIDGSSSRMNIMPNTAGPTKKKVSKMCLVLLVGLTAGCDEKRTTSSLPPPRSPQELFCRGSNATATEVRDGDVKPPDTSGVNPDLYYLSDPEPIRKKLSDLSIRELADWRKNMVELRRESALKKLTALVSAEGKWFSNATVKEWVGAPGVVEEILSGGTLETSLVKLVDQSAAVNCVTLEYIYTVRFGIPRRPLDAVPEIQRLFQDVALPTFREQLAPMSKGKTVTLSIPGELTKLVESNSRKRELRELMDRNKDTVKLLDVSTRTLLTWLSGGATQVSSFDTANFELSGDMIAVIDLLEKSLSQVRQSGTHYVVTSFGLADSRPLNVTVAYTGGADLNLGRNEVAEYRPLIHNDRATSNLHLSIARGYAAAEAFSGFLLRDPATKRAVNLFYGGRGEVAGTVLAANRRVELTLKPVAGSPGR